MRLSCSLSSKLDADADADAAAAAATRTPQSFADDLTAADSDPKPEYVTVIDSPKPLAASSSSDPVIPPIPNSDFWVTNRMKNLIPHPDSDEHGIYDPKLAALRRFQEDIKKRPEHQGMEEFTKVPVEKFAAAYLAGYGWKEGMGIGRRHKEADVKVVQFDGRRGKEGIGYQINAEKTSAKVPKVI